MADLPILAKCSKCGRGFVTLPAKLPAFDPFAPDGFRRRHADEIVPVCDGRIELTTRGTELASADTGSMT